MEPGRAAEQWSALYEALVKKAGADVKLIDPIKHLPDLVFTANAGLVDGKTFIRSNFRFNEREPDRTRVFDDLTDWVARQADSSQQG